MRGDKATPLFAADIIRPMKLEEFNTSSFKYINWLLFGLAESHAERVTGILRYATLNVEDWKRICAEQKDELKLSSIIVSFMFQHSALEMSLSLLFLSRRSY